MHLEWRGDDLVGWVLPDDGFHFGIRPFNWEQYEDSGYGAATWVIRSTAEAFPPLH